MANIQLSENLKYYRTLNDYTQKALAQILNISRQAYSNYELGKRDPDIDTLVRLCKLYHITLDELVIHPFSSKPQFLREDAIPYYTAVIPDTSDYIYLTKEECSFLCQYRKASKEEQQLIEKIIKQLK